MKIRSFGNHKLCIIISTFAYFVNEKDHRQHCMFIQLDDCSSSLIKPNPTAVSIYTLVSNDQVFVSGRDSVACFAPGFAAKTSLSTIRSNEQIIFLTSYHCAP